MRTDLQSMVHVVLDWHEADDDDWDAERCLYAYLHPDTAKILYLGKADYSSADERWRGHERDGLFEYLERKLRLEEWDTIVGDFVQIDGVARLSPELLTDTETLLIWHLDPPGNVVRPEPNRPGLRITCKGDWPLSRTSFIDPE